MAKGTRGLRCFVLVAFAASLSLLAGVATAQGPAKPKPLWQINEDKLGVPRKSPDVVFEIMVLHGSFGFQNNNTLFVSWITPDGPLPHLPKSGGPTPVVRVLSHLHVLFLDAKTGARLREQELSVPSGRTDLFISHSGNLIVHSGNSVKLYTPDFVLLSHAEIPAPANTDHFDSEISPDGRRVFLCSYQEFSSTAAIFDADDLKSLGFLPDGQHSCSAQIGDDSPPFNGIDGNNGRQSTIQSSGNEPRNPPLRVAGSPEMVHLLNSDAFLVADGNRMEVRTINGKVLMTDTLPEKQTFKPNKAAEARDNAIFAVRTTRVTLQVASGFGAPILIPVHLPSDYQIAVYNIKEKRRIFAIRTGEIEEYALSPDGSLFATLSWTHLNLGVLLPIEPGKSVAVYKLP